MFSHFSGSNRKSKFQPHFIFNVRTVVLKSFIQMIFGNKTCLEKGGYEFNNILFYTLMGWGNKVFSLIYNIKPKCINYIRSMLLPGNNTR